jgi:hypothetical protein
VNSVEATHPELTQDSESQSLPMPGRSNETARLFLIEEDKPENSESIDIIAIIRSRLREAKTSRSTHTIKTISKLSAVLEYVKLRARYIKHNTCKRPCLSASAAIAIRVGKGLYFARQIRQNELYLKKHHYLPPPKRYSRHGHHTLLDNESVLHDVRAYLAAQALGTVTPRTLCKHVNEMVLPTLRINGTISKSTAQRWLRFKLGYECKETKKGVYMDGHERPDVIKERGEFLEQIFNRYER